MHNLVSTVVAEGQDNIKNACADWNGPRIKQTWESLSFSGLPQSWKNLENIPTKGLFKSSYRCSRKHAKLKSRRKLAATVAGWAALPNSDKDLEQLTVWWAVLAEVPDEVVMVVEFFFARFASLSFHDVILRAFGELDSDGDNGLTLKELEDNMRSLGFKPPMEDLNKKLWWKNLEDTMMSAASINTGRASETRKVHHNLGSRKALAGVLPPEALHLLEDAIETENVHLREVMSVAYKYLTPSGSPTLNIADFKALESTWRELQQITWEFRKHLRGFFGSFETAWSFADQDDSGEICWDEFKQLVLQTDFDGPMRHIFQHMDYDQDGTISEEEFMAIDTMEMPQLV